MAARYDHDSARNVISSASNGVTLKGTLSLSLVTGLDLNVNCETLVAVELLQMIDGSAATSYSYAPSLPVHTEWMVEKSDWFMCYQAASS